MEGSSSADGRHHLFVIVMEREMMNCNELRLPERFVRECGDHIPQFVRLRLPNGHEFHVYFKRRDNMFCSMSPLIKECQRLFRSCMIYSYEGDRYFDVFVLKEDFCEVDYLPFKTKPLATVCVQGQFHDPLLIDNTYGIGWKFILTATEDAINFGEIVLPGRFGRSFGKNIPEGVSFRLSNSTVLSGFYNNEERKFTGLSQLFGLNFIQENDLMLFTYRRAGNFDIIVFDNGKVEKKFDTNTHVPEVETEEIGNLGVAVLEIDSSDSSTDDEMSSSNMEENDANEEIEMNDASLGFSAIMTKCNVNNTSHGPYIPRHVNPPNRKWIAGEFVTFRSGPRVWDIGVVYSGCLARFSAGWNTFARDKKVRLNETLVFNLLVGEGGFVFEIDFPMRI